MLKTLSCNPRWGIQAKVKRSAQRFPALGSSARPLGINGEGMPPQDTALLGKEEKQERSGAQEASSESTTEH